MVRLGLFRVRVRFRVRVSVNPNPKTAFSKKSKTPTPRFTDILREPRHGFLSVRSLEFWNRLTCILCMWLPFLIGQAIGLSLTP